MGLARILHQMLDYQHEMRMRLGGIIVVTEILRMGYLNPWPEHQIVQQVAKATAMIVGNTQVIQNQD